MRRRCQCPARRGRGIPAGSASGMRMSSLAASHRCDCSGRAVPTHWRHQAHPSVSAAGVSHEKVGRSTPQHEHRRGWAALVWRSRRLRAPRRPPPSTRVNLAMALKPLIMRSARHSNPSVGHHLRDREASRHHCVARLPLRRKRTARYKCRLRLRSWSHGHGRPMALRSLMARRVTSISGAQSGSVRCPLLAGAPGPAAQTVRWCHKRRTGV